jgi:hypothetical protein
MPLAKYIPQYLFDGLVVKCLMCGLAETPDVLKTLLSQYGERYPDEPGPALVRDVRAAARECRHVPNDLANEHVCAYPSDALQALMQILEEAPSLSKPMWRRMLENLFLDVQPTPIADRVAKACDHIRAAGDVLRQRVVPAR